MNKKNIPVNVIYRERINKNGIYDKWLASRSPEYFEYRKNWQEFPENGYVSDFPLNLDIEPTNKCNLKCPFCYRTLAISNHIDNVDWDGIMTLETYKTILSQIVINGKIMVPAIKLTHRGEPLLNKNLGEFVKLAKDAGACDVMVNTNGTLLTEDIAKNLLAAGLDKLLFSFDSPYKKKYEDTRIGANYDKVLDNIKMFVKLRNSYFNSNTLIRVGMVVTEGVEEREIEDFYNLFCDVGADVVSYNSVHAEVDVDEDGYFFYKGERRNVKKICFADSQLWQRMTINWNGDAEICCENYKQETQLGNIKNKNVHDIWCGATFQKIRDLHSKSEWWKIPQCKKCTLPYMNTEV